MNNLIFILDDDFTTLTIIEEILSSSSFNVKKFFESEELLKALDKEIPNLIILDILMPDIDGINVCSQIKNMKNSANIPVIMLSAKVSDKSKKGAFSAGASGFITKPFTARELISAVKTYIELYNM